MVRAYNRNSQAQVMIANGTFTIALPESQCHGNAVQHYEDEHKRVVAVSRTHFGDLGDGETKKKAESGSPHVHSPGFFDVADIETLPHPVRRLDGWVEEGIRHYLMQRGGLLLRAQLIAPTSSCWAGERVKPRHDIGIAIGPS